MSFSPGLLFINLCTKLTEWRSDPTCWLADVPAPYAWRANMLSLRLISHGAAIMRLKYTHEAMIDLILAEPTVTNKELATIFEYSEAWISHIRCSDSFQSRIAERKALLIDPAIRRSLEDRLSGVTVAAIDRLQQVLDGPEASAQFALDALGVASSGLKGL